tara:strand:- start:229 stop:810 length:582 start_codon:yes stop_codon:yes gene_type:complete
MKRIITLILALSTTMFAQEVPDNFTNFGVYIGGAQLSATYVDDTPDGFEVGSVFAMPNIGIYKGVMLGSFPVNVGVGYGNRGWSIKYNSIETTSIQHYLDIMIGAGYPMGPVNLTGLFLLGSSMGSGKIESDGTELDYPDEDFGEYTDYGLMFGLNYPINDNIGLDVGYYLGLAEVDDAVKYNGIAFSLGYRF